MEEGTIVRAAETFAVETKDPTTKTLITSLIGERKNADIQYREFITNLDKLSQGLGKGRIRDASDAQRFLDGLNPEKVADRLFQKNNAGFMQFFQKKYPEQAKQIYDYQKSQIISKAIDANKEIKLPVILREVNKLPKEVKNLMFTKDELSTIENASKYTNALPPHLNPSQTEITKQTLSYLNPLELPGKAAMEARDLGILAYLKGSPKTLEEAIAQAKAASEAGKTSVKGSIVGSRASSIMRENKLRNKRIKAME
jgi:hypothetical protein